MTRGLPALGFLLVLVATMGAVEAHGPESHSAQGHVARLPRLGPAPDFSLIDQDGRRASLHDYRGKVVAVTFIYTYCPDICPMLTANMAQVQNELGADFGKSVAFISITVDPARDTPRALKEYADSYGADLRGWAFMTGDPEELKRVGQRYGIFASRSPDGQVDHTLLTSIVDRGGQLRVQYIGARFDIEEFRRDLLSLLGKSE